jgi:hypothetical protein
MPTVTVALLTVVAESVLAERLVELLKAHGASGYTLSDARGEGSRGRRVGEIPGDNVRVEVLVAPAVADRLLGALAASYFADYAVVAWITDARVARGEKYGEGEPGQE